MKKSLLGASLLLLSGCGQSADNPADTKRTADEPSSSLERAAIAAGVIPDSSKVTLSGAFERRSDLGVDRFCAVGSDESDYQIGVLGVFGPDSKCEGMGVATREGEQVQVTLDSEKRCDFLASFDGVELKFPGLLPDACASYCTPRASLAGVSFFLVGEGDAVARSTRGREIDNLCPSR